MLKYSLLTCVLVSTLIGCKTVPTVQAATTCPRLPELEQVPAAALERNYSNEMANFLQGLLPTPTGSGLGLRPVKPLTAP
jgi:hypothetical protein